jgi:hypothetical protein
MSEPGYNDELRALIALEKQALEDPGAARSRLAERLGPRFGAGSPGGASPAPAPRRFPTIRPGTAAGLGIFGAGIAVGAVLRGLWPTPARPVEVRYVDRVVEAPRASESSIASAPPAVSSSPEVAASSSSRTERPTVSAQSAPTSSPDEDLARERQVIDKARSALARGDAQAALSAVAEHAGSFRRGQLAEMREAVAVQALVRAGKSPEARARAERFHRAFPGSMYGAIVDGAISSIP